jgi:putative ABC transport system substrate-binding protein
MRLRLANFRLCGETVPARRRLLVLVMVTAGSVLAAAASAQPATKLHRVGILSPFSGSNDSFRAAVQQRLRELGYFENRNVIIDYRAADGAVDRLPRLASELVKLKVDVIITTSAAGVQAAKQETRAVPIVMAGVDDAIGQGFVPSLAHPGGNITGTTWLNTELSAKRVELLKQTLPSLSRIAFLREAVGAASSLVAAETAARALGLRLFAVELRVPSEVEGVFSSFAQDHVGALMVAESPMISGHEKRIVELAMKYRMPTIFSLRTAVENGGLMSYGPKSADLYRRAADYADRILKGAKPGALPVEQPTGFELVINQKTANVLGIKLPESILLSADAIIR